MGSFNEVCALSSLNISCGTPVRLLFLTQNPYVCSDQREQHRGCYHYDQWFVRTPPLKAVYADYGNCTFKATPLVKLIESCFQEDVVERPFGFNEYHAGPVSKGRELDHYLKAAWRGRLLVKDEYVRDQKTPVRFPTWQKVHTIFKEAGLPLQIDKDEGYNAQPVQPGVVCVTYNTYDGEVNKLKAAMKLLSPIYDCKFLYKIPSYKNDPCVLVVPKEAFKDKSLLLNDAELKEALSKHPELNRGRRELPCLSVMVREDVWKAYYGLKISADSWCKERELSIPDLVQKLKKACTADKSFLKVCDMSFREMLFSIPYQTTASTHIVKSLETEGFKGRDELLHACAELSKVEALMATLHHSWQIPSLGGQQEEWKTHTKLLKKLVAIGEREIQKEKDER